MPSDDWIALSAAPLDTAKALEFVTDERAGGIAMFLGVTRAEQSSSGHALLALDYEAYPEMAEAQLQDLAQRARENGPIRKLVLLHRVGRVGVAEPSVVIVVSTPHRGQAFEACRWLIDTLKAEVAIWKKEIWAGEPATWK